MIHHTPMYLPLIRANWSLMTLQSLWFHRQQIANSQSRSDECLRSRKSNSANQRKIIPFLWVQWPLNKFWGPAALVPTTSNQTAWSLFSEQMLMHFVSEQWVWTDQDEILDEMYCVWWSMTDDSDRAVVMGWQLGECPWLGLWLLSTQGG